MGRVKERDDTAALRLILEAGYAEKMGDGMFVLFQTVQGVTSSLTLCSEDLEKLLAA